MWSDPKVLEDFKNEFAKIKNKDKIIIKNISKI
jgi:hypothetical protein